MRRKVISYNQVEGFHEYADAPKNCASLNNKHHYFFEIRCKFEVSDNDREIEMSCLTGIFKNDLATRNEFLNIVRHER